MRSRADLFWQNGTTVTHKKSGRTGTIAQARGSVIPDQYLVRWDDGGEQWINRDKLRVIEQEAA